MIDIIASAEKNKLPNEVIFEIHAIHEQALADIAEQHYKKYKKGWKDAYKYASSVVTSNTKDMQEVLTKIPKILCCAENTNFEKVPNSHFIHRIIITNQPLAVIQALINYSRMNDQDTKKVNAINAHIKACCEYVNAKNNFSTATIKEVDEIMTPIESKKISSNTLDAIKQLQSEIPDLHLEDMGIRMDNVVPPNIGLKEENKKYMVCPQCSHAEVFSDKTVCPNCHKIMKAEVVSDSLKFFIKKILANSNNTELFYYELKKEVEAMRTKGITSDKVSTKLVESGMSPVIVGQFLVHDDFNRFKNKVLQVNDLANIRRG